LLPVAAVVVVLLAVAVALAESFRDMPGLHREFLIL
jgi:hypothetical protein